MSQQDADRAGTTSTPDRTEEPAPAAADQDQDAARAQVAELEDRWRRTAAELDNYRKRTARESANQREDERVRVLARWLPIVDNLELALAHADADSDAIIAGIRAVRDQALAVLAEFGYPRYDDQGEPFDPNRHEAVGTIASSDERPGTVVHVVRPRYGDGGHILRPAAVIVAAEER
jgi:molecular chaperone GrpE